MMIQLRDEMAHTLDWNQKSSLLESKRTGRTFVTIRAHAGSLATYQLYVEKVTGKALKQRVEKKMGIPWEAQHLYYGAHELKDEELLNVHMSAGGTKTVDLIEAKASIMNEALKKRGSSTTVAPVAAKIEAEKTEISADKPEVAAEDLQKQESTPKKEAESKEKKEADSKEKKEAEPKAKE